MNTELCHLRQAYVFNQSSFFLVVAKVWMNSYENLRYWILKNKVFVICMWLWLIHILAACSLHIYMVFRHICKINCDCSFQIVCPSVWSNLTPTDVFLWYLMLVGRFTKICVHVKDWIKSGQKLPAYWLPIKMLKHTTLAYFVFKERK